MAEQFNPFRIRRIVVYPLSVWSVLSNEQRATLYQITQSAQAKNDIVIDWYRLLTNYEVNPDSLLQHGTSFETEITIEKLIDQWEEELSLAGRDSPINISWKEYRFRVPDPRVGEILPPMSYPSIDLTYPKPLKGLEGTHGWEIVQQWLADDAAVALDELYQANPQLPPLSPPDFYNWFEPEVRDQWARFWRERAPIALEASKQFVGRVFHIPGIPGNEKLNAMREAGWIANSAKEWGK